MNNHCESCDYEHENDGSLCSACEMDLEERANTCHCGRRVWAMGLCLMHFAEDEAIQRLNDRNTSRPIWAQKLNADAEARHDW